MCSIFFSVTKIQTSWVVELQNGPQTQICQESPRQPSEISFQIRIQAPPVYNNLAALRQTFHVYIKINDKDNSNTKAHCTPLTKFRLPMVYTWIYSIFSILSLLRMSWTMYDLPYSYLALAHQILLMGRALEFPLLSEIHKIFTSSSLFINEGIWGWLIAQNVENHWKRAKRLGTAAKTTLVPLYLFVILTSHL